MDIEYDHNMIAFIRRPETSSNLYVQTDMHDDVNKKNGASIISVIICTVKRYQLCKSLAECDLRGMCYF